GKTIAVFNPSTGKEIGRVAHASKPDLDLALAAAQQGFGAWRDMPAAERAKTMRRAAALMRDRAESSARSAVQEQGNPSAGAKAPVGPVAACTPWNFPINQVVRKLAAALGAGCSILVKAPEETPASPAELIRAFADAGVPAGTVGLVYGDPAEISNYLIPHPVIRKVTFTGSTPVGKQLAALAGKHMKRVTMELGGHAPVIIAEDADLELAIKIGSGAKFRNAGQVCISPTRYLV